MSRQFVILDRDGTLVVERHYLTSPEQLALLPRAAEALRTWREMGLGIVVITNQSAVARGYLNISQLQRVHRHLKFLLASENASLDGIYFCPHLPKEHCSCRKPRTGLVAQAVKKHGFDPTASFVIGDKSCDIELGKNIGATTFLVRTGYGNQTFQESAARADHVVHDLMEAARIIQSLRGSNSTPAKSQR